MLAVAVLTAGCASSTPGTAQSAPPAASSSAAPVELTADQVGAAVVDAAHGVSAVHVGGTVTESGATYKIDVQLNKDSAGGTITEDGGVMPVRRIGTRYYAQLTDGALKAGGVPLSSQTAKLMRNKWVSSDSKMGAGMVEGTKS